MDQANNNEKKENQIIAAARKLLTIQGSSKATIKEIAAEAGVSRGLLHYYFNDKEELLTTVIRASEQEAYEMGAEVFRNSQTAEELAKNLIYGFREIMKENPGLQYFLYEGWVMGRQKPNIGNVIYEYAKVNREDYQKWVKTASERGLIRSKIPVDELGVLVLAILLGIGHMLTMEPDQVENDLFWRTAEIGIRHALRGEV
jgi:AcrR family transcriptional regulator